MSKVQNDAYYTPVHIANHCWDVIADVIGEQNISEIIEPSCGDGAFYQHPDFLPHFGYDIDPHCSYQNVFKADFLTQLIVYLPGRLVIGNPPYGRCMNLAQKFYRKAVEIGDYIAFILPISQLNNTQSLYEFDLIYSEDLGVQRYTDRYLHCCFNIYRRPASCVNNTKPITRLKDVSIWRQDSKGYADRDYDVRMCYWGDGTAGKILTPNEHYAGEYKIKVNNPMYRDAVVQILTTFDWQSYLNCIAMRKIQQFHIVDVLRKELSQIK